MRTNESSEDEDNNNICNYKNLQKCDKIHTDKENTHLRYIHNNFDDRESRSRSRSLSRSPNDLYRSRSRSSSTELEVDSPPPPAILQQTRTSRTSESPVTDVSVSPKKSETFSVSALLRQDQPSRSTKSLVPVSSFGSFRYHYQPNYEQTMLQRPMFSSLPWLAAFAFHQQGQQPNAAGR